MDKIIRFSTHDTLGRCFAETLDITPRGGGHEKVAGELDPKLRSFISGLKSDPRYQYVLMTPMGAFEYWGMNVNGDIFPEASLAFDKCKDRPEEVARKLEDKWLAPFGKKVPPGNYKEFGYTTFMNALRYRHHANKNPDIAYGDIVFVTWNSSMHRVELIARHDREKAKRVGAEEIISDLDNGKPRQISMGCKVPFDVCTVCGHVSRTPQDYCEHLRFQMGKILPDGKIVGAVNFFPRFFDLSDVFIPAAKESGVLMKVAEAAGSTMRTKSASSKAAAVSKQVLPNATNETLRRAISREPALPTSLLKARPGGIGELLSTLALLGIVAKPSEFQYSMLHGMGRGGLADKLHRSGRVFSHNHTGSSSLGMISARDYSPQIARTASPFLSSRSGFYPHLPSRMLKVIIIKAEPRPRPTMTVDSGPVLDKVAAAYRTYRESLWNVPKELSIAVETDPEYYRQGFFNHLISDSMQKTSSLHSVTSDEPLVPLYLYNAYRGEVSSAPLSWNAEVPPHSPARALLGPVL